MEEYLKNMKSLRSQMNDFEEEASNISMEEEKQRTAIQIVEKDLESVKSEIKRLKDETDEMAKTRGKICCQILEKQKKIWSLGIESATLAQTHELLQQEKASLSEKLREKSAYYTKVQEDLSAKFLEQQDWLASSKVKGCTDMQMDFVEGNAEDIGQDTSASHGENCAEDAIMAQLESSTAKLEEIKAKKTEIALQIRKSNELIEKLKNKFDNVPAELKELDPKALGEEHDAVLADKAGEMEYLQSLHDRIEQLQGISEEVKCQCGAEYKVELKGCDPAIS